MKFKIVNNKETKEESVEAKLELEGDNCLVLKMDNKRILAVYFDEDSSTTFYQKTLQSIVQGKIEITN